MTCSICKWGKNPVSQSIRKSQLLLKLNQMRRGNEIVLKTFLDSLKERRARAINDFHKTSVRSERKARNFVQIVKKKTTSGLFRQHSSLSNFLWPIAASYGFVRVSFFHFSRHILHVRALSRVYTFDLLRRERLCRYNFCNIFFFV